MPSSDASAIATLQRRTLRHLYGVVLLTAGLLPVAKAANLADTPHAMPQQQERAVPSNASTPGPAQPMPNDIQVRFAQAVQAAEQGRTQEAIDLFTALARDYPYQPEIANNLAVLYAAKGDDMQAAQVLQQVVRASPNYATGHENLGDVYARMASNAYAQAIQLDVNRQNVHTKLALAQQIAQVAPHVPRQAESRAASVPPDNIPPQAQSQPPATAAQAAVEQAVRAWAQAWASQDIQAYYAAYSPRFEPPAGAALPEWKAMRKALIVNKPSIALALENLQIQTQGQRATARFLQAYAAGTIKSRTRKTLHLERVGEQWLIVREDNHSPSPASSN